MFTKDNIEKLSKGLETQYSNGRAYEPGEAGYAIVKSYKYRRNKYKRMINYRMVKNSIW